MLQLRNMNVVIILTLFGAVTAVPIPNFPSTSKDAPKANCGYQSCHPVKEGFINVHLVPHTHDDVGWLKTVDQYYYGSKGYIQNAAVEEILDSVIQELIKDENRRFIYVETAYFWKWWMKQHDIIKHRVQRMVRSGQLEFIGGAWSMNDEATTNYQSIIDQFTWGLRKLNESFGECGRPKVGWQIDPFGHSREMASIFAQLGFDGLLLGRIDYQDKEARFKSKTAEMIWQGSDSLGKSASLFTSVMYNTYSPPPGFCFDILCNDEPIIDDVKSPIYNVPERIKAFLEYAKNVSDVYKTSNIIITMGEDFNYQDAHVWFKNIDKLISYSNALQQYGSKFNLLYSTPSCYLKAVKDESAKKNIQWPVKTDDFFPYASDPHAFWTGYFTSRPTIKRFEREGNNFLQVCKQLYALTDLGPEDWVDLNVMREAMGVMQHHDAITGTEKEHVAHDYARILSNGFTECEYIADVALTQLMNGNKSDQASGETEPLPPYPLKNCPLLNVSSCNVTENLSSFVVTVYNPLGKVVNKYVRLPVTGKAYSVRDPDGKSLTVQLSPIPQTVLNIPGRNSTATAELIFLASGLPPLGFKAYYVEGKSGDDVISPTPIENSYNDGVHVKIDGDTGLLSEISMNGVTVPMTQEFLYYKGTIGDNRAAENRSSGAYIFRPNGTEAYRLGKTVQIKLYQGDLVTELHQVFSDWVSQIIRVYNNEDYVEFNWIVGPIPIDDIIGKEIISRFTTPLSTNGTFYTDSNGRELLKRIRNYRPAWNLSLQEPVSGNYYPVTSRIVIKDEKEDIELAVLTDRAQGGSSLEDGEVELMVHRSCLHDDSFGVGEALNEQAFDKGLVVRGSHYVIVGSNKNNTGRPVAVQQKELALRKLLKPWIFTSPTNSLSFDEYKANYRMQFSGLQRSLPDNVHILTLEPWQAMYFLLRLEHIYEKDEDPILSQPATVDLKDLFAPFVIVSLRETTLGANQWLNDNERLHFGRDSDSNDQENDINYLLYKRQTSSSDMLKIVLNPMQIRTFVIDVKF